MEAINYFSLFGIAESLHPDAAQVKKQFYALSKQWHPDRFAAAGVAERNEALRMAALLNDAYKTLSDPDKTLAYLLRDAGVLAEEEAYKLPTEFLMEMMELNEAVSDYEAQPEDAALKAAAEQSVQAQLDALQQEASQLAQRWEQEGKTPELLNALKDFHFRKKYLLRIRERMPLPADR
ncbi:DnaJ domain-containing protein [Rurimicrobium arvi]|uniref:Co-chaperone HscB n=1 Tax=Rurimicrobium arvi TaxID=2049916 RepID=A0ABP8MUN2_9BACT